MSTHRWRALPEPLRRQVDALVLKGAQLEAVACLRQDGPPGLSLPDCVELVDERFRALVDQLPAPPPPASVESLLDKVAALPWQPEVIEAVWDGDTTGWLVALVAVRRAPRMEAWLISIRHGSDLRLFNGQVPPWPEAEEATRLGTELAGRLLVPFYFDSPHTPDPDPQRWWDT